MGKIIKNTVAGFLLLTMSATTALAGGAGTGEGKGMSSGGSSAITYNVGFMTAYWYRGAFQNDSAINFGADYEAGNISLGTWWVDVGASSLHDPSLEIDLYGSYAFEMFGIPSHIGVTGYYYTDDFDQDYEEVNFGMDFGLFSFDSVIYGDYKAGNGNASKDYGHFRIDVPLSESIGYSWQTFTGGALHYAAHELTYSTAFAGADVDVTIGRNNDGGAGATQNSDQETGYATLSLSYSF
ncbi:MAG: TorF family putative porin [Pseudomonadota bacterium]|nr:TorF family putative porin [Pseudomonadota bacterium]|tara:strand:- start:6225 stop:6941 length:717 start_codon:yes stop_codon:yes gene_type:complete